MSAGYFDYKDSSLCYDIFGYDIDKNNIPNEFEDIEISILIYDVFQLIHSYDLYMSGDTSIDDYKKDVSKFKNKWLKQTDNKRIKKIIDNKVNHTKKELYDTFTYLLDD